MNFALSKAFGETAQVFQMCAYPGNRVDSNAWQATSYGISKHLRDVLELTTNSSALSHQKAPKKLTTEAVCMILVLLVFVILTLIGSSIDIYEYLRNRSSRKKTSGGQKKLFTNGGPCSKDEKLSETTVWKICKPFLNCFSMQQNWKVLFNTDSYENYITCFDGIRALGIWLVVQSHVAGFYAHILRNRKERFLSFLPWNPYPKGFMTINSLMLISGYLIGHSVSLKYHRSHGKISWLSVPLQTFIRYTPASMIVVGIYTTLFPYLGSGPLWPEYDINPVCRKNWIWNLLYLNNFLPPDQQCITPLWNLACVMQLNIISPLLVIPIIRKPKMGYTLAALVSILSCLLTFVLIIKNNLVEGMLLLLDDHPDLVIAADKLWPHFEIMHTKPYTRIHSYSVGIALGCYVYSRKSTKNKKFSLVQLSLGWLICVISLCLCSTGLLNYLHSDYEIAAFYCVCHLFHAFGWSWIIYLCVTDQTRFLNRFLSCNVFKIVSRFSLPAYLLHLPVLEKYFLSFDHLIDHSVPKLISLSLYPVLWVYAASFIFSLIFGVPILKIYYLVQKSYQKKICQKIK